MKRVRALGVLLAVLLPAAAVGQQREIGPVEHRSDLPTSEQETPRPEESVTFPAYPEEENLIPFQVDSGRSLEFFIDEKSISVDDSGIVRYTVLIRSASGANNVTYEGMRCGGSGLFRPTDRRVYGHAAADRKWRARPKSAWEGVQRTGRNDYPLVLSTDFFCPRGGPVRNAAEAIDALKRGCHPRALACDVQENAAP